MGKIGRNDPCLCGSGKKYKKCCLGKNGDRNDPIVSDRVTHRVHALYSENSERIGERLIQVSNEMLAARTRLLARKPQTPDDCAALLEEYMGWLERSMGQVLKRRSPVFWLSVERRLPPWILLRMMKTLPGHEGVLLRDMRQVMTALMLKHSSWDSRDWGRSLDGTLVIEPDSGDIIDLWGDLLPRFYEASDIGIVYRRTAKGAQLGLTEGGKFQATLPEEMERSVQLYQERRLAFGFTLSPVRTGGTLRALRTDSPEEFREDNWHSIFFDYNEDEGIEYSIPAVQGKVRGPGFIPKFIPLEDLFLFLRPFEEKIEAVSGLTLDELRLSLVSLKNYILDVFAGRGAYTCLTRGLVFVEKDWLFQKLQSHLDRVAARDGKSVAAQKVTEKFVSLLECKPEGLNGYDFLLRKGCRCLITQGDVSVIDLTLVPLILADLLIDLELDDESRRIKGAHYESRVVEQLKVDVPGLVFPIAPGTKLRRRNERQVFAEVDVCIGLERFLIIVECKAWSLTRGYFKGERREVEKRLAIVREWQNTNDSRAKLVAAAREGSNYQVPAHITHIVPVVCSAAPEFVWGFNENDFVTEKIPRVCSYPELVQFCRGLDGQALLRKPFVVPIAP